MPFKLTWKAWQDRMESEKRHYFSPLIYQIGFRAQFLPRPEPFFSTMAKNIHFFTLLR